MSDEITQKIIYLSGKASCLAIIPRQIAEKKGIHIADEITIEEVGNGIVIKKKD